LKWGGRQRKYKTMLTQIYEIATPAEAEAISAIGVDHIGVLVGDGCLSSGASGS
jgi:phosphoribosylanthranilate isomerase